MIGQLPPPLQITHIPQFNNPGNSQAENIISIPSMAGNASPHDNTTEDQQSKDPASFTLMLPFHVFPHSSLSRMKKATS